MKKNEKMWNSSEKGAWETEQIEKQQRKEGGKEEIVPESFRRGERIRKAGEIAGG